MGILYPEWKGEEEGIRYHRGNPILLGMEGGGEGWGSVKYP